MKTQLGMIGLGVMGRNLALNVADHGFGVAGWDLDPEARSAFAGSAPAIQVAPDLPALVATLQRPRTLMLMVPAGRPVDLVLAELVPLLEEGDIVIDGGNTWFEDTNRRERSLAQSGLYYFGVGVSGGEDGARNGPALMPGGDPNSYRSIAPLLEAIAAKTEAGPCVGHVGPQGAGHFVKMVHNGIEYADMQLIAEAYDVLRRIYGLDAKRLGEVFAEWNRGTLESFLIEITAKIFSVRDQVTGDALVELVLDRAGQKGTGRWTVKAALDLGVAIPTITAAVDARILSSHKAQREVAQGHYALEVARAEPTSAAVDRVRDALFAAKICAYAQGMSVIRAASHSYDWKIDCAEIARIWKGGCIIRARFLDTIRSAYAAASDLPNLLVEPHFVGLMSEHQAALRELVGLAAAQGVPTPALSASLAYFDAYRSARLPQNLTQAQRDAFGAHTYLRVDDPSGEALHTDWLA